MRKSKVIKLLTGTGAIVAASGLVAESALITSCSGGGNTNAGEQALVLSLPTGSQLYMDASGAPINFEVQSINGASLAGLSGVVKDVAGSPNNSFQISFTSTPENNKITGTVSIKENEVVAPGEYTISVSNGGIVTATQSLTVSSTPNSSISLTDHQYTLEEVEQTFTLSAIVGSWTGSTTAPISWDITTNSYVTLNPSDDTSRATIVVNTLPSEADVTITVTATVAEGIYDTCVVIVKVPAIPQVNTGMTISGGLSQLTTVGQKLILTVNVENWNGSTIKLFIPDAERNYLSWEHDQENDKRFIVTYGNNVGAGATLFTQIVAFIGEGDEPADGDLTDKYDISLSNNPVASAISAQVQNNNVNEDATYSFLNVGETKILRAEIVGITAGDNLQWSIVDGSNYINYVVDSNDRTVCTISYITAVQNTATVSIRVSDTISGKFYIVNITLYPETEQVLTLTATSPVLNSSDTLSGGTTSTTISQSFSKYTETLNAESTTWSILEEGANNVVTLSTIQASTVVVSLDQTTYAQLSSNSYVKIKAENNYNGDIVTSIIMITILQSTASPADVAASGHIESDSGNILSETGKQINLELITNLQDIYTIYWHLTNGSSVSDEFISIEQSETDEKKVAFKYNASVVDLTSYLVVAECKNSVSSTIGYFTFEIQVYPINTIARFMQLTTGHVTAEPDLDNSRPFLAEPISSVTTPGVSFDVRAQLNIDATADNAVFWALEWTGNVIPDENVYDYFDISPSGVGQRWYSTILYKKRTTVPLSVNIVATLGGIDGSENVLLRSTYMFNLIPPTGESKLLVTGLTTRNTLSIKEGKTEATLKLEVGGEVLEADVSWTCSTTATPVSATNITSNAYKLSIDSSVSSFGGGIYVITATFGSIKVSTTIMIEAYELMFTGAQTKKLNNSLQDTNLIYNEIPDLSNKIFYTGIIDVSMSYNSWSIGTSSFWVGRIYLYRSESSVVNKFNTSIETISGSYPNSLEMPTFTYPGMVLTLLTKGAGSRYAGYVTLSWNFPRL